MTQDQARIVIVGGGAIGCSLAYHLAKAGARDVVLLEKAQLTHGSTWHAAGLVGQLRGKRNLTRLMCDSVALFDTLSAETGQEIDWKKVGSLRVAASEARWSEIKRALTLARGFGFEAHEITPKEAKDLFPYMSREGVVGAAYIPSDGYVDPYALTQAYAKGARAGGVEIREGVLLTDLVVERGRVTQVITDQGPIACEVFVNCAGIWAKQVGALAGLPIAAGAVEHQYVVTEKAIDFDPGLTTFRDPDHNFYLKPDVGAFAVGGWEQGTKPCWRTGVPNDFARTLFDANFDRFEAIALPAAERIPLLNEVGIQTLINGPIPVSADGEPIMGLAPGFENLYLACGFTAGIAASGGAGKAMANWILEGDPGMDLWAFDARRFGPHHANRRFLEDRAVEAYGRYYAIHWPGEDSTSGRDLRLSPLHGRLKAAGAVHGSKFGWERPKWFARPGDPPEIVYSFEDRPSWFEAVGEEHRAVRERVALIDQTSFAKFRVSGPGAYSALQGLAAGDLSRGGCLYTQLCNARGGIEADLTIMTLADGSFYIVTGSGFGVRDGNWLRRHLPRDGSVALEEVTSAYAVINLCGPLARAVLEAVTDDDVSAEAFPFLAARQIQIGQATVLAARIGYVGELGWELHIPVENGLHVYDSLWRAGQEHGIANVGYLAIESLRLEKGYCYWSAELSPEVSPFEAGLGFCVALDKGDFLGRAALAEIADKGSARQLCSFSLEGFAPLSGGEAILHNGEVVGTTSSGGYGHTLGRSIALGTLPRALAQERGFTLEAYGRPWPAVRGPRVLYDAKMERLKG
ncbi:MAG: FAD-dependent oxidoreductase [Pseudomonadota bacterium]